MKIIKVEMFIEVPDSDLCADYSNMKDTERCKYITMDSQSNYVCALFDSSKLKENWGTSIPRLKLYKCDRCKNAG